MGALLLNDVDIDGDTLSVVLGTGPANGTLTLNANGSFVFVPNGTFSGTDAFTYFVTDGLLNSAIARVDIEIVATIASIPGNAAPTVGSGAGSPASAGATNSPAQSDPDNTSESSAETEPENSESTDNASSPRTNFGKSSEVDPITGFAKQDVSGEILRRTSSEQFVAIFLDAVPEETRLDDKPVAKRGNDETSVAGISRNATFLFAPLTTSNPLFSAGLFATDDGQYVKQLKEEEHHMLLMETVVVGTTAAVSTSVTVGYVIWLLRGGSLLTTFLSSLPAWQSFDPLPVLDRFESDDDDGDGESLASMITGSH